MDSIKYRIEGDIYVLPASLFDANRSNSSTDPKNFLNISKRNDYKLLSLISGLAGIIFIITCFLMYKSIKNSIDKEIEKIMSYIPKFK